MEVTSINAFLSFYGKVREVTERVIAQVPPDKLDWTYRPEKFTVADLIRHIAAIERNLFAEAVMERPIAYRGCGKELADGYEAVMNYFNRMHDESMAIFRSLEDADLKRKIVSAGGRETSIASFLRALVIHEVHHRGALCIYLNLLEVKTPPILGLTAEEVIRESSMHHEQHRP